MTAPVLAVDFGTSNSAVAILEAGCIRRIAIEGGRETLPTAVFFPAGRGDVRFGSAAGDALIGGDEGRYMRALKSVLGTSLLHEVRRIEGRRMALADVITAFIAELRVRAEEQTGRKFTRVLSGRPVRFHSTDDDRDARAEADLRGCYEAAGFEEVRFLHEPEAAALAADQGAIGAPSLVLDIGGGTSDFSVFRGRGSEAEILASHGIRLGGTDFDQGISMTHAMPLFGHGGELRRSFGEGLLPVPVGIYRDLSDWAAIPFLYTRDTEREVADLLVHAVEPDKIGRLQTVITERLGHETAFAVERGKIAANGGEGPARIGLEFVEAGLGVQITAGSMNRALNGAREALRTAIYETLFRAGTPPSAIGALVLVGGSSLMRLVAEEAQAICPGAQLCRSGAFTAVVDGLAIATGRDRGVA